MKTAMQELLEWVRATLPMDLETPQMIERKIESLLEKEMAEIIEAFHTGMEMQHLDPNSGIAEEYYSLRFKTKEK